MEQHQHAFGNSNRSARKDLEHGKEEHGSEDAVRGADYDVDRVVIAHVDPCVRDQHCRQQGHDPKTVAEGD